MSHIVIRTMICCPFKGLTSGEIDERIALTKQMTEEKILSSYQNNIPSDIVTIDDIKVEWYNNRIGYVNPSLDPNIRLNDYRMFCLGNGLSNVMSECQYVVLGPGWEKADGCVVEALTADIYGKYILAIVNDYTDSDQKKVVSGEDVKKYILKALEDKLK